MKKITDKDLKELVLNELAKIKSAGYPNDLKMGKMDKSKQSDGMDEEESTTTGKSEVPYIENAPKGMNTQDKEHGHDEKIKTAVAVEATSKTKKGGNIEGQHEASFTSKKENPKLDDRNDTFAADKVGIKPEMNTQDDNIDDKGQKVFVKPGTDLKKGNSIGQKKAISSQKAENEKEKVERIAKGIQLPESFRNKKELLDFVKNEAIKITSII